MPDGQWYSSFYQSAYGAQNDWVTTSSTEPVTIGTFHLMLNLTMEAPPVTMTVTAPRRFGVRAIYPTYTDPCPGCQLSAAGTSGLGSFTRFSGSRTYDVVDAGYGTPADFAGLNARGKLVLLRIYNDATPLSPCLVQTAQLDRAIKAGSGTLGNPQQTIGVFGQHGGSTTSMAAAPPRTGTARRRRQARSRRTWPRSPVRSQHDLGFHLVRSSDRRVAERLHLLRLQP
jgi:hypothetical protein